MQYITSFGCEEILINFENIFPISSFYSKYLKYDKIMIYFFQILCLFYIFMSGKSFHSF